MKLENGVILKIGVITLPQKIFNLCGGLVDTDQEIILFVFIEDIDGNWIEVSAELETVHGRPT